MFSQALRANRAWVLKGGYALELRFHQARSTKDLDLTVTIDPGGRSAAAHSTNALRERLQLATIEPQSDFFTFVIGEVMLDLDQAPEGGARFPVDARLDGRTFVKFHVDLGVGDEIIEPLDTLTGDDWLGFAGIPAAFVPALSAEQHWAGKLHAYTRPQCRSSLGSLLQWRLGSKQGRMSQVSDQPLRGRGGAVQGLRRYARANVDQRASV